MEPKIHTLRTIPYAVVCQKRLQGLYGMRNGLKAVDLSLIENVVYYAARKTNYTIIIFDTTMAVCFGITTHVDNHFKFVDSPNNWKSWQEVVKEFNSIPNSKVVIKY